MNPRSVWNVPLDLRDWALVFAAPTNRQEFDRQYSHSYYLTQFTGWDHYFSEIASDFSEIFEPLQSVGLNVYPAASVSLFRSAVRCHRCVLIVAHCEGGNKIEFRDQLIGVESLAKCLPRKAGAIYDYSICQLSPESFEILKRRSPKSGICGYKTKIDARSSINYIGYFLSQFIREPISYIRADLLAKKKFLQ